MPEEKDQPVEPSPDVPKVVYGPPPFSPTSGRGCLRLGIVLLIVAAAILAILHFGFGWGPFSEPKVEYGPPPAPGE
jgi:hypothetical protein